MIARAIPIGVALVLAVAAGCSSGDYTLERRGGPFPTAPVVDPLGGSSGTAGNAAGAGEDGSGGAGAGLIPWCDALLVIVAKCQRCHGDPLQNSAPVAFLTYDDLQAPYYDTELKWWEIAVGMVERDVMPFVDLNGTPGLVGGPVEPLTVEEKPTLLGWLQQGALPEGGTDCP